MRQGVYRHYKGGLYTALMSAVSADNRDDRDNVVVYLSHTTGQVYVRSAKEFFERVKVAVDREHEKLVDRFEFVADSVGPPVRR